MIRTGDYCIGVNMYTGAVRSGLVTVIPDFHLDGTVAYIVNNYIHYRNEIRKVSNVLDIYLLFGDVCSK